MHSLTCTHNEPLCRERALRAKHMSWASLPVQQASCPGHLKIQWNCAFLEDKCSKGAKNEFCVIVIKVYYQKWIKWHRIFSKQPNTAVQVTRAVKLVYFWPNLWLKNVTPNFSDIVELSKKQKCESCLKMCPHFSDHWQSKFKQCQIMNYSDKYSTAPWRLFVGNKIESKKISQHF